MKGSRGAAITDDLAPAAMRSGYENGYEVITLDDCTSAMSYEECENALADDFPMFSEPMSSDELIAQLD